MARPTDKQSLLAAAAAEFDGLMELVATVDSSRRSEPGACEHWSVKDILAHLDAWHHLFIDWERVGSAGEKPEMPAPGYTWKDTPALNASIYERCRNDGWDDVIARLRASHDQVVKIVESYDDADLSARKRFGWTGTTSVSSYAVSATSSHYAWATKLIRSWLRTSPGNAAAPGAGGSNGAAHAGA